MILQFVLVIIISNYLRRSMRSHNAFPVWNLRLQYLMYIAIGLMSLSFIFDRGGLFYESIGIALLGLFLYVIYKNPVFKNYRFIIVATMPYLITSFIGTAIHIISFSYYEKWKGYLDNANAFAVLWGFGVWLVTNRQRKELEKSRKTVEVEKQNTAIVSSMRDELEVQVQQRTAELTRQKEELELALEELKATQAQLIQSEKMASLGELTAGIAHEIQNPLNFVNNFSEVNKELLGEMKEEIAKQNFDEVQAIIDDITGNEEKISFHGKRADAIVKGMLQHSRKNTGQKEATDINDLCDEYLRLSYHGLRAKDKSFNADFKSDFDTSVEKIDIVPQDIGRVILNLLNNAFYAVNEKKKTAENDYKPTVIIRTKKEMDSVMIVVEDNGNGIPQSVIEKIFQPFFTTKPTGSGTGLGLSMSYDIITKEHNGTIQVQSEENVYTRFIISLPS